MKVKDVKRRKEGEGCQEKSTNGKVFGYTDNSLFICQVVVLQFGKLLLCQINEKWEGLRISIFAGFR